MTSKKNQPQSPEAQLENLDQILSEIDDLQAEIQAETAGTAELPAPKAPHLQVVPAPEPVPASTAERAAEAALEGTETDILEEFRAGSDESAGNLETTLADLSDEAPAGGGLLDQLLADEVSASLEREHLASLGETDTDTETESTPVASAPTSAMADKKMEKPMKNDDEGSLTMTLKGNVTLKLQYEFEGQEVSVGFEGGFLKVVLADDTEFKVPVARARAVRKAA